MIEPPGTPVDVIGFPNTQTRSTVFGNQPGGMKQNTKPGGSLDRAQDDPGMGQVSTAGIGDNVPPVQDHGCYVGSQSMGAAARNFGPTTDSGMGAVSSRQGASGHAPFSEPSGYDAKHARIDTPGLGTPGWEGKKPAPDATMPDNVLGSGGEPLSNISTTGSKSVIGNAGPTGRVITSENASTKDIGVQGSDASQGALIKTPGLAD